MKFKSYQVGGAIYTPFISNRGATPQSGATPTTTASSKSDKIGETIEKEIINIIKESGIESDVNLFLTEADNFLNKSRSLSATSLFGGDVSYTMSDLIHIQKLANSVKENKSAHKDAATNLTSQQAWNDVAMTTNGGLYVMTEKGLEVMDASEYAKADKAKVQALTNSQLMGLRESRPELAFATHYLYDMSGAIGFKTVTDQLVNTIKDFGIVSRSEYVKNNGPISQSAWDGMQILIGDGPEGYYKATTKSEREHINSAVDYLWDILGKNGQARLKAEIAATGGNPNNPADRYDLILKMLQHHTNFEQSVDFDKSATEYDPDGDGKGNTSSALGEVPYLVRIGRGDGERELVNISMRTDGVMQSGAMIAWASNMGNLIDKNGNTLGMDSLPNILTKAEAIKATRSKDITFGGQLLNDIEKNFIVYDGASQVTDIWLPFKNVGGKITPDFDKLQKFNEWNDWVYKNPGITKVEKMNEAYKRGLDPEEMTYDETTGMFQFKPQKMKLFLSFSAYADNDNVDFTKLTEDLTEEMPTEFGRKYKDVFNNLFEYGKTHRQKSDKKVGLSYDKVRGWDLRKGNVFIPIDSDFLAMHMSMTEYAPKSEMNQFAARSTATRQMNYNQDPTVSTLGQFM